jgi:hypothetical protein
MKSDILNQKKKKKSRQIGTLIARSLYDFCNDFNFISVFLSK